MDFATRYGTTIQYGSVREVVMVMSSRFYRQSRRDPSSVNPREFSSHMNELFSYSSGIDLAQLIPDAVLA